MREAISFDGQDDIITIPDHSALDLDAFTISLWVQPIHVKPNRQPLLTKGVHDYPYTTYQSQNKNYMLSIEPNSMRVTLMAGTRGSDGRCLDTLMNLVSNKPLFPNQWNHVLATYDGEKARLYLNGSLDNTVIPPDWARAGGICKNDSPVEIGNFSSQDVYLTHTAFSGQMDEVAIYASALTELEAKALYEYQVSWFDTTAGHTLTVDADKPVAHLDYSNAYIGQVQGQVMAIAATDQTSGVALVEYRITGAGQSGAWQVATQDEAAWTFAITTTTGAYTIDVRATDRVGNVSNVSSATFSVDSTPPSVSLDSALTTSVLPASGGGVTMTGAVADSASGVENVHATLLDHAGVAVGGTQSAQLIPVGTVLHLPFDEPAGAAQFSDVSGHNLDGTCPGGASSCPAAGQDGQLGKAARFDGVNDYVQVAHADLLNPNEELTMAAWVNLANPSADQKLFGKTDTGSGYILAVAVNGLYPEIWDSAGTRYAWRTGYIPANTWTHVAATWRSGGQLIGYINGQEIYRSAASAKPIGANTMPFRVGVAPWNVNGGQVTGLLDDVRVYDRALSGAEVQGLFQGGAWQTVHSLPPEPNGTYAVQLAGQDRLGNVIAISDDVIRVDSTAPLADVTYTGVSTQTISGSGADLPTIKGTVGEAPYPTNSALRLHFEEPSGATQFYDGSTNRSVATCSATSCPTADQSGGVGKAVQFDGVNDYVRVSNADGRFDTPQLTLAAWVKPEWIAGQASGNPTIMGLRDNSSHMSLHIGNNYDTLYTYKDEGLAAYPYAFQAGNWYHISVTWDGSDEKAYVNGQLIGTTVNRPLGSAAKQDLIIGSAGGVREFFQGILDEVAIYNQALTADQIHAIANPVSSGVSKVEIGFLHARDKDNPEGITWNQVNLAQPGQAFSTWSYQLPEGLEGPHQIYLRAADGLDNVRTLPNVWQGEIDTWAPRVSITSSIEGDKRRYTTVAQDYNLREQGFTSPCGAEVIASRTYFTATWYTELRNQAPAADQVRLDNKLYQLTATCLGGEAGLLSEVGVYDLSGEAKNVVISGDPSTGSGKTYAYVANGHSGLRVVDVSDPTAPHEVAACAAPVLPGSASGVALAGDYAYIASAWGCATFDQWGHCLSQGGEGLHVVDISNPTSPIFKGTIGLPDSAFDVAVSGDPSTASGQVYAYVAAGEAGLRVVDVSDPTALHEVGVYDPPGEAAWGTPGEFYGVAVSGTHAYVADWSHGLRVVDISDPAQPTEVGAYGELWNGWMPYNSTHRVAVSGNHAYLTDDRWGLLVVDISDPAAPRRVGRYEAPSYASGLMDVALSDDPLTGSGQAYAYVAARFAGLLMVDISDPTNPQAPMDGWSGLDTPGEARGVAVSGDYAYVTDGYPGSLRVMQIRQAEGPPPAAEATAYDLFGSRGSATLSALTDAEVAQLQVAALQTAESSLDISVNAPSLLLSTTPYTLTGHVVSTSENSLRALTVTVDSQVIYTDAWAMGAISGTWWAASWTPAGEGAHTVAVTATDWLTATAVQTATVTLDTLPPAVGLTTRTFTKADHGSTGGLNLAGVVTDVNGVHSVYVAVGDANLSAEVDCTTGRWRTVWSTDRTNPPDGVSYTAIITATDNAGYTTSITDTFGVDVVLPASGIVTLAYVNSLGVRTVITPGMTIYDVLAPTLFIDWTAASDGSGIARYLVGWAVTPTLTVEEIANLTSYATAGSHAQTVGEAQKLYAHVVAEDNYGNQTVQTFGPVYADYARTPDYISMDGADGLYRGWMDSGCSLIGRDARVSTQGQAHTTLREPQKFYATWDDTALRLAWTGADWDHDGDLFIYLDTITGGTEETYNPLDPDGEPTPVQLGIEADYLIWVQDDQTAQLWHWDDSLGWLESTTPPLAYSFEGSLSTPYTDLYIPWDTLGISDPTSTTLNMIAFTTEEDSMRVWATMPVRNPVNSQRLVHDGSFTPSDGVTADQAYSFALNGNVCPSRGVFTGAEVHLHLRADPPGLSSDMFDMGSWATLEVAQEMRNVGDGEDITYYLKYANTGVALAANVVVTISTTELQLHHAPVFNLGDIMPGEQGTLVFTGTVALSPYSPSSVIVGVQGIDYESYPYVGDVYPVEINHGIDVDPPRHVEVLEPRTTIRPGSNTVKGAVFDVDSITVPTITLQAQDPSGSITDLTCPDSTPDDAHWACDWDAGLGVSDGDQCKLRIQATDRLGHASDWTDWLTLTVDAQSPTLTLDSAVESALSDGLLSASEAVLSGQLADNRLVSGLEVCQPDGQACQPGEVYLDPETTPRTTFVYDDVPPTPIAIDNTTFWCQPDTTIVRTFVVSDSFTVSKVSLGFNADHTSRCDLAVSLMSPAGTQVELVGFCAKRENFDVLWDDATRSLMEYDKQDHDTAAPYYENVRTPLYALDAFNGQDALGVWELWVCDRWPNEDAGLYNRSRLILSTDALAANTQARWSYSLPDVEGIDGITRTLALYGLDSVGNRSTDPLSLTLRVDTVPPAITYFAHSGSLAPGEPFFITGSVSDGGGVKAMRLSGLAPNQDHLAAVIPLDYDPSIGSGRNGATWYYSDTSQFTQPGIYTLWVEAIDQAGNRSTVGPFAVNVQSGSVIYLPEVLKDQSLTPD